MALTGDESPMTTAESAGAMRLRGVGGRHDALRRTHTRCRRISHAAVSSMPHLGYFCRVASGQRAIADERA